MVIAFGASAEENRKWYDQIIEHDLSEPSIDKSALDGAYEAEFRVLYNVSLTGYAYYSMKVLSDGTAQLEVKLLDADLDGDVVLDEKLPLTAEETMRLTQAIEDKGFWDMAVEAESSDSGGSTVFIEGYSLGKSHLIRRSNAEWTDPASAIRYAFSKIVKKRIDYAEEFAPLFEMTADAQSVNIFDIARR